MLIFLFVLLLCIYYYVYIDEFLHNGLGVFGCRGTPHFITENLFSLSTLYLSTFLSVHVFYRCFSLSILSFSRFFSSSNTRPNSFRLFCSCRLCLLCDVASFTGVTIVTSGTLKNSIRPYAAHPSPVHISTCSYFIYRTIPPFSLPHFLTSTKKFLRHHSQEAIFLLCAVPPLRWADPAPLLRSISVVAEQIPPSFNCPEGFHTPRFHSSSIPFSFQVFSSSV